MFRSPPQLRSGAKVKSVLQSTGDKIKLHRASSAPSTPTETTEPMVQNDGIDNALIEGCVSKYLADQDVIDALVNKLPDKIKEVVEPAVPASMSAGNEELVSLCGEVVNLEGRLQDLEAKVVDRYG